MVVEQDAGDRYAYRLRLRIVRPKSPKPIKGEAPPEEQPLKIEMRLTDYRATLSGQKVSAGMIGGGETPYGTNGLPGALNMAGPSGPIWIPLLSLYLPPEEGGFKIPAFEVGTGMTFTGEGTAVRKDGALTIEMEGGFLSDGRELGRMTMKTLLDREGWPASAEGELVNGDGTYRFTLGK